MAIFPGTAITPAGGGYTIDQSLRFNDDDSAYLSRTPASAGNRKTWTWSGWLKQGNIPSNDTLFSAKTNTAQIWFAGTTGQLRIEQYNGAGGYNFRYDYEGFFRDPSAWYHIVVAFDTANATEANRIKVYVNGVQRALSYTYNSMTQNFESEFNNSETHWIGTLGSQYFDGYLSDVYFIDGQALGPEHFGYRDATYGDWRPQAYSDGNPAPDYGSNGFHLEFASGAIGTDSSPMGNDWTANNLSGTNDVVLDSPTNNFATLNPLSRNATYVGTLYEGNLRQTNGGGSISTFSMGSGKWYWEYCVEQGANFIVAGMIDDVEANTGSVPSVANPTHGVQWISSTGNINKDGTAVATYATWTTGDILGFAYDQSTQSITFYKNGSSQGSITASTPVGAYTPQMANPAGTGYMRANFGQDSSFAGNKTAQNNTDDNGYGDFYYPVPSGFLSLCSANLSEPAVVPGENFNTVLYTGNGSTQSITGVGFQPDFLWIKNRGDTASHGLQNAVTGADKQLRSNSNAAEEDTANNVTSFDSDGFSLGNNSDGVSTNENTKSYVAWNWKADNTSGSSNTDGSITSTVAANPDAGFSIVTFTGTGSTATVGHGLSSAPDMVIVKGRSVGDNWHVLHDSTAVTSGAFLRLNATEPVATNTNIWGSTLPTSSVFTLGPDGGVNSNGGTFLAYCFHSVDGFSKFGSYTGNGSTDGPFVYTGFRPAFVIWKNASASTDWHLRDTKMSPYNVSDEGLFPNGSYAESTDPSYAVDILSNGFKPRNGTGAWNNASGATYIYMAFAEYPFKFSTAR